MEWPEEQYPYAAWAHRVKYQPSLDGHLRAKHVPPEWVALSRDASRRLRADPENEALRALARRLDAHIVDRVLRARAALPTEAEVLRQPIWRRAILWARARVAARRLLERRVAQRNVLRQRDVNVH